MQQCCLVSETFIKQQREGREHHTFVSKFFISHTVILAAAKDKRIAGLLKNILQRNSERIEDLVHAAAAGVDVVVVGVVVKVESYRLTFTNNRRYSGRAMPHVDRPNVTKH